MNEVDHIMDVHRREARIAEAVVDFLMLLVALAVVAIARACR